MSRSASAISTFSRSPEGKLGMAGDSNGDSSVVEELPNAVGRGKIYRRCLLPNCEEFFSSQPQLEDHVVGHRGLTVQFYCAFCPSTTSEKNYRKHLTLHHADRLR